MPHRLLPLALGLALLASRAVCAQHSATGPTIPAPRRALALGVSAGAGVTAVEWVHRRLALAGGRPVGASLGVGVFGPGVRAQLGLRGAESGAGPRRVVPYLGLGYSYALWTRSWLTARDLAALEGGVQFWPRARGGHYVDLGASALTVRYDGAPNGHRVLPRVLIGGAF